MWLRVSEGLLYAGFVGVLVVATWKDMRTRRIPDACPAAITVLAVLSMLFVKDITLLQRVQGGFCISLPMLILALLFPGAFGGGDIKLMAAGGLFLGGEIVLVSSVLGTHRELLAEKVAHGFSHHFHRPHLPIHANY